MRSQRERRREEGEWADGQMTMRKRGLGHLFIARIFLREGVTCAISTQGIRARVMSERKKGEERAKERRVDRLALRLGIMQRAGWEDEGG